MKLPLGVLFASASLLGSAAAIDDDALQALGRRAFKHTKEPPQILFEVDRHIPKDPHVLADDLHKQFHPRPDPILIYCRYPDEATPLITKAFSSAKPGSLKGLIVVCAVGVRPSAALKTAAARSGATVDFEPIP